MGKTVVFSCFVLWIALPFFSEQMGIYMEAIDVDLWLLAFFAWFFAFFALIFAFLGLTVYQGSLFLVASIVLLILAGVFVFASYEEYEFRQLEIQRSQVVQGRVDKIHLERTSRLF